MTACRNLFLIYGPWYCSIFLPFSLSGCLKCSFGELRVTWLWTSFPDVKYSLKTGGSSLCLCLYTRFGVCTFVMFWTLRRFRFLYKSCVCPVVFLELYLLEICFAVLEFASCIHYMHFHTLQSHKESEYVYAKYILYLLLFLTLYLTILYEFANLFNCFVRSSICVLKLKDSSRIMS